MTWFVAIAALFVGVKWGVVLGVLAYAVGYMVSCWWWEEARCLCCGGSGRHWRKDGKVFRRCGWCSVRGARRRVGRVVLDAITR